MFQWPAFLTYIVVTAITPGPNVITSMSNGTRYGVLKALPFNFGIFIGVTLVGGLSTIFTRTIFHYIPTLKTPMLVLGAGYILWMAYRVARSEGELRLSKDATASFHSGLILQFLNPKLFIYVITAFSSYVLPHYQQPIILLGFVLLLATNSFLMSLLWSSFGSMFRKLFSEHRRAVNYVMAGLLVYCAVALFF